MAQYAGGCGLIKDLKTRYSFQAALMSIASCGLIKDLKTRYLDASDL